MNSPLQNPSVRIALLNYGLALVMAVGAAVASRLLGDPPNLTALKVLVAPLFLLANIGLDAIYRKPIVEDRWTVRAVEHAVLRALCLAVFVAILIWTPAIEVSRILLALVTTGAGMAAFNLYEVRREIARLRREATPGA